MDHLETYKEKAVFLGVRKLNGMELFVKPETSKKAKIDLGSANALELTKIFQNIVPSPISSPGIMYQAGSVLSPDLNPERIKKRQEAVVELHKNQDLRRKVENMVRSFQARQKSASDLFSIRNKTSFISLRDLIAESILLCPKDADSEYLSQLFYSMAQLEDTEMFKFSTENAHRIGANIVPDSEKPLFSPTPVVSNSLSEFRIGPSVLTGTSLGTLIYSLNQIFPGISDANPYLTAGAVIAAIAAGTISSIIENDKVFNPLITRFETYPELSHLVSTIGEIDELLSLAKFGSYMDEQGIDYCMPEIVDACTHSIKLADVVNLLSRQNTAYIPARNIELSHNIHFLTGPNSGGKTTNAKAVAHAQLFGQMGSYVPASSASIVPADKIFYHVGENDTQTQQEGGYGSQLERGRDIIANSGKQSLTIIDDLIEGTDPKQIEIQTNNQFYALARTGANVVIISHKYDMAQEFKDKTGLGNYLKIEFKGDHPTRQIVPGISFDSKGHLVAQRVGMNQEGIEVLLRNQGKLGPEESLYDLNQPHEGKVI